MRLPNGFGSIHKLSGNRRRPWRVRVTKGWNEEGKQLFDNLGYCETRADAMMLLAKYNENPWDVDAAKLTFADVFDAWYKMDEPNMKPVSARIYQKAYSRTESIQKMNFNDIRSPHIQAIIDGMTQGYTTKKTIKTLCNKMYEYALKFDIATKNYSSFVNVPKDEKPINPHVAFTDDEVKNIMKQEGDQWELAKMLIFTGMRINELLSVQTENVHLDKGYLIGGSKTDAGKDRVIPISRHIRPIIEKWYNPDKKKLIDKRGMSYQSTNNFWHEHITGHTPHDSRHTFISLMNRAEVNDVSIERIAGHSSQGVTKSVYTHKTTDDLIQAMNRFDDYCSETLCI